MGRDEQIEEREVLDSIFPDEITDISDVSYRVSIVLDLPARDEDDAEPPNLLLTVTYPLSYPDVPPDLDLSAPPNTPKHPDFDVSADKSHLISSLSSTIEESLGMAMIFTLVSTLKDAAEQLIIERRGAAQALREAEATKVEEEENRRFQGTTVNRKSFLEWRDKFRREMEMEEERKREEKEAEDKKKRGKGFGEEKLTGKMLWERGLIGKVEEEDEGEDAIALEGLKIDG